MDKAHFRHYKIDGTDYRRVSEFLIRHHQPDNRDGNWLEPAWEYMHNHALLDPTTLEKIGIWEDGGSIVAAAHCESRLGEAFFQFHPDYRHLREEALDYAENNLCGYSELDGRCPGGEGGKYLCAYVNDDDEPFTALVKARGYELDPKSARPMAKWIIPNPFPPTNLTERFRLTSLADEPDWGKVNRALWRGFDHSGEPPASEADLEDRRKMFDTPSARRELKIAVAAPDGHFIAFCGMFYEPTNRFAYVEPVATDPDYRRMGLGKAAVREGIRRCAALGAVVAYVGSDQPFYLSMGFEVIYKSQCWRRYFS